MCNRGQLPNRYERRAAKKRQRHQSDEMRIEFDGTDMFFVIDGRRVAQRGHAGTTEARQWIPLVPDFSMHDNLYGGSLDALASEGTTEH